MKATVGSTPYRPSRLARLGIHLGWLPALNAILSGAFYVYLWVSVSPTGNSGVLLGLGFIAWGLLSFFLFDIRRAAKDHRHHQQHAHSECDSE
jgi:hypothetical protein